jgi:peroxiredoxin
MQLAIDQPAPDFATTDVFGNVIHLKKLSGQKVYLAFERNAGCPVCNLHVHELLKRADFFKNQNIKVVLVYESTVMKMREYLSGENHPFHFVADPQNKLYKLYGIEQSYGKLFKSLFNGLMKKVMAGNKLFKKTMAQDGHLNTIPSEFLIDEKGLLQIAYYGKFVGDVLPINSIK